MIWIYQRCRGQKSISRRSSARGLVFFFFSPALVLCSLESCVLPSLIVLLLFFLFFSSLLPFGWLLPVLFPVTIETVFFSS